MATITERDVANTSTDSAGNEAAPIQITDTNTPEPPVARGDAWTESDEKWARWWAGRYRWALSMGGAFDGDDLAQAARIGIITAREKWPHYTAAHTDAPVTWATFSAFYIRNELRQLVGIRAGTLPPVMRSLDEPIAPGDGDDERTMADTIADSAPPMDERITDDETRVALVAAVNRIQDETARAAVWLIYVEGLHPAAAAATMGTTRALLHKHKARGLQLLRRDMKLKAYLNLDFDTIWAPVVGVMRFKQTHRSSVEVAVERREMAREAALVIG